MDRIDKRNDIKAENERKEFSKSNVSIKHE
jgi:hypothetical protein